MLIKMKILIYHTDIDFQNMYLHVNISIYIPFYISDTSKYDVRVVKQQNKKIL